MILSRAPLRISLGGGGTDLPAYARQHGGFVVSAAIDRYVYVSANQRFEYGLRLSYSKTETVDSVSAIEHPIFREALRLHGPERGIELVSVADVPANTGLGSSGAFTVALVQALHAYRSDPVSASVLAEEAAHIENDVLGGPGGKQDQYASAHGGVCAFTFRENGSVGVERLRVSPETVDDIEARLLVFWTGVKREAAGVLTEQGRAIADGEAAGRMHTIWELGHLTRRILENGDLDTYGALLHEHWTAKRATAGSMSDPTIDAHYDAARAAGALGGKLIGAGGGGFLMVYAQPERRRAVCDAMLARGLRRLRYRFDGDGARIVANMHRSDCGLYP